MSNISPLTIIHSHPEIARLIHDEVGRIGKRKCKDELMKLVFELMEKEEFRLAREKACKRHEDDGGMFYASCKHCGKVLDDYEPGSIL